MADEVGGLIVKVGMDSNLFQQGVSEINKKMALLKSEFSATSSKLKEFGSDTDKLKNKADFLGRAMEVQKAKVQSLSQAYEKSKNETGENSKATQELAIKLNRAVADYNKFENELKQTQNTLQNNTKELEENGNAWDKLKKQMSEATEKAKPQIEGLANAGKKIGLGFATIGTALVGVGVGAVKFGDNLNGVLNGIQASTGYTDEAMSGMKDTLVSIYNSGFGESFADIGEAIKIIGQQSGATGDELKGLTENALTLRDTFGFEVNESFRSAKMLMDQFGMSGEKAYNLITQGAQWGLDKNGDLLDTINEYSVQFKSMGFRAEEMFNMLVNGAMDGTWSVDKLGDAVKEFGIRTKDGSKGTIEAFQSLGLNANELSTQFAKGGESGKQAFETVNKKLLEMKDPLKQNQVGVALYGTMWEDLGVKGIKALTETSGEITNNTNALEKMNQIKYNDLGSAFEGIKRNIMTGIFIPLSERLLPKLSDFSNWFIQHMPEIQQNVKGATDVIIPIFDELAEAIKFVKDNSDILIPVLVGLVGGIIAFQVISTIVPLFTTLTTAIKGVGVASAITNAIMAANPFAIVAIVIGTLIAVGVLLYKNWDTIKAKAGELKNEISEKFTAIKTTISEKWEEIKTATSQKWEEIKALPGQKLEQAKSIISDKISSIKSTVSDKIEDIKDKFKNMFNVDFKLPHIPLPHFPKIVGEFSLNPPSMPHLDGGVNWYDRGGIFNSPSIIGVGEKRPEFVGALDDLRYLIRSELKNNTVANSNNPPIYITVVSELDGEKVAKGIAQYSDRIQGNNLRLAGRGVGI